MNNLSCRFAKADPRVAWCQRLTEVAGDNGARLGSYDFWVSKRVRELTFYQDVKEERELDYIQVGITVSKPAKEHARQLRAADRVRFAPENCVVVP